MAPVRCCMCIMKNGSNALHMAAQNPEVLEMLIGLPGADINSVNNDGETPLHIASRGGSVQCVHLCARYGASFTHENKRGKVPEDVMKVYATRKSKLERYFEDRKRVREGDTHDGYTDSSLLPVSKSENLNSTESDDGTKSFKRVKASVTNCCLQ
eukprot:gb/GECG01000293.1/.p1 GENE.gb/GECG01000293.1/~~gb/GECG01000293.1/.p1  ORF type:complete len:155 (+),score=19.05 gb/GECG01000293.1/:1-465(+)